MATLTETAYWTRKIIHWGTVCIIALLVFRFLFIGFQKWWVATHPPPPEAPRAAFGLLPMQNFPRSAPGNTDLTYNLQTVDGNTPYLGDRAKVYFMPKPADNFLSFKNAEKLVKNLGFTGESSEISKRLFVWTDSEISYRTIQVDIVSGNFTLKYDYKADLSIALEKSLPNKEKALGEISQFLNKIGLPSVDLLSGEAKTTFLKLTGNQLTQTTSLSEADFVRVDLFRPLLDNLPVFSFDPTQSLVYFIISGSTKSAKRFIEIGYTYNPLSDNSSDYYLRSSADAYKELTAGNGYVAKIGDNNNKINILKIYLAYFEPSEPQTYMQPVYVFEGEKGFFAYVPAIAKEFLNPQ